MAKALSSPCRAEPGRGVLVATQESQVTSPVAAQRSAVTSRNSVAMVTTQQSYAATQLAVAGQLFK
jgi:hypothetical protein